MHHLTYEHLYDEYDTDLLVCCEECHEQLHNEFDGTEYDPRTLKGSNKMLLRHREKILERFRFKNMNIEIDCLSAK